MLRLLKMVFESVVVDILNRYLKPYVKKLDTSQLKVGVWKGEAIIAVLARQKLHSSY